MTSAARAATTEGPADDDSALREIAVDRIDPNPEQPRRHFDEAHIASIAESIRVHGVIQPIVVRRAGDRYELVVGEQRWRACRAAGLDRIPAVVANIDPKARLEVAIVENVQRRDLNPMELAHAYRALSENGLTQEEIGQRVSMDRSSIANHMRLLDLSRDIQEDIEETRLTMGHAKALLQVANPERRRHLRDRILEQRLSVRDSEQLARESAGPARREATSRRTRPALDPNLTQLIDALRDRLQTQVRLQGAGERGRLEIEYFGAEDLERISRLILDGTA